MRSDYKSARAGNIKHLLAVLLFVPALCPAQTATQNYVKTVTMLDAAGEKLRVIYQTAVPNITVAIGSVRELSKHH